MGRVRFNSAAHCGLRRRKAIQASPNDPRVSANRPSPTRYWPPLPSTDRMLPSIATPQSNTFPLLQAGQPPLQAPRPPDPSRLEEEHRPHALRHRDQEPLLRPRSADQERDWQPREQEGEPVRCWAPEASAARSCLARVLVRQLLARQLLARQLWALRVLALRVLARGVRLRTASASD